MSRSTPLLSAAFAFALLAVPLVSCGATDSTTTTGGKPETTSVSATSAPPGEALAPQALEGSPRHHEWVDLSLGDGQPRLRTFVAYPERKDKAPVVVVIQEIFGNTPWIRSVADRLAADGFIAIAPDYLSGMGPGGGGSDSVKSRDDAVKLTRGLAPEEVMKRTHAAVNYGEKLPASNGRAGTMGFCWGGSMSFLYAAEDDEPDAAVVFYGSAPDSATLLKVDAPVLGLYGEDDARVNATIPTAKAVMAANKEFYEANLYPGAGHGFLRAQTEREGANSRAAGQAWPRAIAFLREHLETPKAGSSSAGSGSGMGSSGK